MDRWREESRRPWLMDGDKGFMQQQHPACVSKEELQGNLQKAEEDMTKERTETPSFMFSRVLPSDQLKDRQKLRCLMSGQVEQLYRIFSTNKRRRWTSRRKMPFAAPKKPWQSSQPGLSGRTNPSTADTHTDMESRSNHQRAAQHTRRKPVLALPKQTAVGLQGHAKPSCQSEFCTPQ